MNPTAEMFREIILDHHKNPTCGQESLLDAKTCTGTNNRCGDKLLLKLSENENKLLLNIKPAGCAISTASASIMVELLNKKDLHYCQEWILKMLHKKVALDFVEDGDIAAICHVIAQGNRIPCALLPWVTLEAALNNRSEASIS